MRGDEQATMLGVHHWVARQLKANQRELKGSVVFQDVKGRTHRTPFFIDTSFYEWALADETELLKAERAMTELPAALAKMTQSLERIGRGLKA